jgi:hypothetical protein
MRQVRAVEGKAQLLKFRLHAMKRSQPE